MKEQSYFISWMAVVLRYIFTNENRQRIFNKIGDTLVIKIKKTRKKIKRILDIKRLNFVIFCYTFGL